MDRSSDGWDSRRFPQSRRRSGSRSLRGSGAPSSKLVEEEERLQEGIPSSWWIIEQREDGTRV